MYDITDLSDAALEVFLDVRSGEECVPVAHLSLADRLAVCRALGVRPHGDWFANAPDANPRPKYAPCKERAILDRQDEFYGE